jgi:hypothetical protein
MKRFAGDEPEAEDIARNFTFGTSVPGGYGTAGLDLTRDPRIEYGDFDLYDEFLALGPGGESAFEGYNIEIPNSEDQQVGLVAAGWASSLKDNPVFQEIYVDRDLSRWTGMSAARKIVLLSVNAAPIDGQVVIDPTTGEPCIELLIQDAWASPWTPAAEALYDAGPSAKIGSIRFSFAKIADFNAAFNLEARTSDADSFPGGVTDSSGDLYSGGAGGSAVFAPAGKRRYAAFAYFYPATPAGGAGARYAMQIKGVIVIGNHGVAMTPSYGVLGSDVMADIINRAAPLLTFTLGTEGSIQPSTFSIQHLIYPGAVTAEDAILQASKYDVPDWGVYDNREFFWRPPSAGRLWVARQGDSGTTLKDAGKQAEDVYTGVMVQFTDPSGKTFLVGPPGTAGCDYTDASLQDTSETNVLNERGRTRLGKIVVGAITTLSGAIQIGARWLQEELAVSDRGTAQLTSFVQDSAGNWEPVWKVRAGDRIRFDDADGRERRIIETNYGHEDRTNSLTLDSTPHRVEALMERMQVELVAIGSGE